MMIIPTYKNIIAQLVLDILYITRVYRLFEKSCQGVGIILTLHHVVKKAHYSPFAVNHLLEISPEFLEQTILQVKSLGYDIISLDEMHQRMLNKQFNKKFICFTLDDGYIDNYQIAFPIFKKHNVPFAIYVTTGVIEGKAILWWRCLEKVIQGQNTVEFVANNQTTHYDTKTRRQKRKVFDILYWQLRAMPLPLQHKTIFDLMAKYGYSVEEVCISSAMTWDMLEELVQCPLVTIGDHTVNHLAMRKLPEDKARQEAESCREQLRERLGIKVEHFCYPYGDEASASTREFRIIHDLGFKTATTTHKAVVENDHYNQLHALPRIPLNGFYQQPHYVRLLLSGVPTGFWDRLKYNILKRPRSTHYTA